MERLDGGSAVPAHLRGGIVALGNFDGFHRGHQAVVGRAVERARAEGRPALVATFDPHPARYFAPEAPPFRLSTLDQRQRLLAGAGASAMIVLHFDADLAAVRAESFVTEYLIARMGVAGVVTGADFTFGHKRGGDVSMLHEYGTTHRFSVDTVDPVLDEGEVVSSTRIREALREGDCRTATRLLARPFAIEGEVEHGDKRGRELGYPTANISLVNYLRPKFGIYAVRGRLPDGSMLDGAANLGIRPQFGVSREWLEPYFFDFDGDLYGQVLEVEFIDFLRPETRFDSVEGLVAQMRLDCEEARTRLAAAPDLP
jgi:riboflavin kinase / FMN adenylyltransferase